MVFYDIFRHSYLSPKKNILSHLARSGYVVDNGLVTMLIEFVATVDISRYSLKFKFVINKSIRNLTVLFFSVIRMTNEMDHQCTNYTCPSRVTNTFATDISSQK